MFEELKLLGSTEKGIIVETRKGTRIRNVIEPEPGFQQRQCYQLLLKKHGANWIHRKPVCGVYNCAGQVWASRRTAILEAEDWRAILIDDGYRKLLEVEERLAGDLLLYREASNGEMLHIATILEMRPGVSPTSPKIPWVLSKWDSKSGEVMHRADDVPYERQGIPFRIDYWTDRPAAEAG